MISGRRLRLCAVEGGEAPIGADAFQVMLATVREPSAGTGDEINDGARHEDLPTGRLGGHPLGQVNGDAGDVVSTFDAGLSQSCSRWEMKPGTTTRSIGPSPKTWYAMWTPSSHLAS